MKLPNKPPSPPSLIRRPPPTRSPVPEGGADTRLREFLPVAVAAALAAVALLLLQLAIRHRIGGSGGSNTAVSGAGVNFEIAGDSGGTSANKPETKGQPVASVEAPDASAATTTGEPANNKEAPPQPSKRAERGLTSADPIASLPDPTASSSASLGSRLGENRSSGLAGGGDRDEGAAEFFGIGTPGKRFIYVVDASSSMQGESFAAATKELKRSIRKLSDIQQFTVIFFNDRSMMLPERQGETFWAAEDASVRAFEQWLSGIQPSGGTYPREALDIALQSEPDAIFFLTDGQFDPAIVSFVQNHKNRRTAINTIGFGRGAADALLMEIARASGGKFRDLP